MRLLIISIFSAFSILPAFVLCQNRGLLWQETIGGTGEDRLNKLIHDSENNYYVIGTIQSEGENTNDDVLLSKFNSNGQEVWRKIIGGEKDDQGIDLILTSNNQLLVLIYSNSKTGDFSSNKGYSDIFLAQFSLDGNRQWMKNFGGSFIDIPTSIIERSSGEILISAHTRSTNGNVSTSLGQFDLWLLNVNQEGSLIWEKSYGGSEEDFSTQVIELQTGEIMLLGKSSSYNHDIQLNYGDFDVILLKIGPTGKLIWSKNFGGERARL